MDEGSIVSTRGLEYWYPGAKLPALAGLDLGIRRGEMVLLVGASGSGKSSLLRALNGLVPRYHGGRYRGRVEVDGLLAGEGPSAELAARVGLVFQDPERQAVMSRVDNEVAFGLECLGTPPEEIGPRVAAALEAVGLGDRWDDMVSELSSGQAQRLALADIIAMGPSILALDEPTSQLDPGTAEQFLTYLDSERADREVTVVMAEHRLDALVHRADRVLVLDGGRVAFDGPPEEFLEARWPGSERFHLPVLAEVFREDPPPPADVQAARERLDRLLSEGRLRIEGRKLAEAGAILVKVGDLEFSYETGQPVLRGVDLQLRAGEVMALVGPNGSGKTTLARHLNGLLRPAVGEVRVAGLDSRDASVADLARHVALLTQNPGDYLFQRSVGAELRLTATYRGLEGDDAEGEVARVAGELALEPFMDRFSWDLSAGQRQRVALGALLVGAPSVLVLDEPTRGMDGGHKASLADLARRQAATGRAVMVITHDLEFAARAADRYAVLEEGRVVVEGPPHVVFEERPGYAPVLWKATEGLDLPPETRPMHPGHVTIDGRSRGGGGAW